MLNRRILRIKAFKVMYSYAVRGGMDSKEATRLLDESLEATRSLYLFMLAIVPYLTAEAARRNFLGKQKFSATEEELHPNEKFEKNLLAPLLAEDMDLNKLLEKRHLSWEGYDVLIREIMDSVQTRDYYRQYMQNSGTSLAEDCELFCSIFAEELPPSERLSATLEDMDTLWIDDLEYALSWDCDTLRDLGRGRRWHLPELYLSDMKIKQGRSADSDYDFVHKLLTHAIAGYEKYFEKVSSMTPDWDSDRLFSTDMALIALCLTEMDFFEQIPPEVSINEYVEISKFYCSPNSYQYINGILDKILKESRA